MEILDLIRQPIVKELEAYSTRFRSFFDHPNDLLGRVLGHIKQKNGKMMRPILLLLTAKEFGEISSSTYYAAVTLELLHTASLVHDDIVDDSDQRRGQASVNAMFDNKIAVLIGDYLLAQSIIEATRTEKLDIIKYVGHLARMLSEGEIMQLDAVKRDDFDEDAYFDVIKHKTATLFTTCCELGAKSVGANEEQCALAHTLGEVIGICFQIRDDIFDYFDNNVGKPTGNDMAEGKLTLPVIYALNSTHDETMRSIALQVKKGDVSQDEIAKLVSFTKEQGGIGYAEKVMEEYRQKGLNILSQFTNAEVRKSLESYLNFVVDRSI